MSDLLNQLPEAFHPLPRLRRESPRASRLFGSGSDRGLWMGGAMASQGLEVQPEHLAGALVIDCAGDLPRPHVEAAGSLVPCIFLDLDAHPSQYLRIVATARAAADHLRSGEGASVFVFCQYGMNRSGLIAGLAMRELGIAAAEAIGRIRTERPGSLSNLAFLRIIETHAPTAYSV